MTMQLALIYTVAAIMIGHAEGAEGAQTAPHTLVRTPACPSPSPPLAIRRGYQSGRSAPTLNTLSCSVTSTEPACAMALQETAARRFCDCQRVRSSPRLAVMLGLRHGGHDLLCGLQGCSRVGQFKQLHHAHLLLKRPSCPGVRPGRWPA